VIRLKSKCRSISVLYNYRILVYSLAIAGRAFASTPSSLVAFITSPLTFNFPDMNSLCAFAFPLTNFPKSSSDSDRVTVQERCQLLVSDNAAANEWLHGQSKGVLETRHAIFNLGALLPVGFSPSPFPTSPLLLRSMCQLSVSPALFFSVNANTAFPCLIASLRSASEAVRALLITSKASEEGNASAKSLSYWLRREEEGENTILERHCCLLFWD
jgi:hypothetical protein